MTFFKNHSGEWLVVVGVLILMATVLGRSLLSELLAKYGLQMILPTVSNVLLLLAVLLILIGVWLYVRRQRRRSRY